VDIRNTATTVPTRPILFVTALLSVLAVALTAWFSLAGGIPTQTRGTDRTFVNGGPFDTRVPGTDLYSPRDPIDGPTVANSDPYSPHDPLSHTK
jgi:hypothetical protein